MKNNLKVLVLIVYSVSDPVVSINNSKLGSLLMRYEIIIIENYWQDRLLNLLISPPKNYKLLIGKN